VTAESLPEPAAEKPIVPAEADATAVAETSATVADADAVGAISSEPGTVVAPLTAAADATPAEPARPRRRTIVFAATRRVASFLFAVALFVGGILIGITGFGATRPVAVVPGDVVITRDPPPPVTVEFITALTSNDADALRSSLEKQPHIDLTGEFERFGIQRVTGVETLGTEVDGTRSATEVLMRAENSDGLAFAINLVILVDGGQIEGFR